MNNPLISVVVPTYNRAQMLRGALDTLVCQRTSGGLTYEIVVVDNASADFTSSVVEEVAADSAVPVRYVYQATPGDAAARNKGVEEARGEWLAFFDDDQFAAPDWLMQLHSATEQSGAAIVGGAVHLDLSEADLARLGRICRGVLREVKFYNRLHPYVGKQLPGCGNAMVARAVFEKIGLFETSMTSGGSDSSFFIRARSAGFDLMYTPDAVIRHRIPRSRTTAEFFRRDALASGAQHCAHFDYQDKGLIGLLPRCAARWGQALLINLPLLLLALIRRDEGEILGRKTLLWKAEGYTRKTLTVLAPRLFSQHRFYESLDFRQGRPAEQEVPEPELPEPDRTEELQVTA